MDPIETRDFVIEPAWDGEGGVRLSLRTHVRERADGVINMSECHALELANAIFEVAAASKALAEIAQGRRAEGRR